MDDFLFPEGIEIVRAALDRHICVWPYVAEAIDLAHLAAIRQRDYSAVIVPGVPCMRRVRNDVNDDAWRILRAIGDPLVTLGLVREFATIGGGDVMILEDGMHVRLKKGTQSGKTSNYPTPRIIRMGIATQDASLFSGATPLDLAIDDGVVFDVVYVAGTAIGEYGHIGLKMAVAEGTPFLAIDRPSPEQLLAISPAAFDIASETRTKLSA